MAKKKKKTSQVSAVPVDRFDEAKYRRQSDARSLADADAIKGDKDRLAEAKKGAGELAPEMVEESKHSAARARAMNRISKRKR